jgi:P pilus assembly chaperone PapD
MPAQTQWTNKRTGFKFKNKTTLYDGIRQVVLKEGRKASIKVTGQNMSFPTQLVQDGNVIVQLANTVGGCWQGCYDAPAQKNTGIKFTDKEAFVCNTGAAAATP